MMRDVILQFPQQFAFDPAIIRGERLSLTTRFIIAGMGGSHLAADLLEIIAPHIPVRIHTDYGLPDLPQEEFRQTLLIASSYSGNTEETIDAFQSAGAAGLPRLAVTTGGRLFDLAAEQQTPCIQLPNLALQPRSALGVSMVALLKAMQQDDLLAKIKKLAETLDVSAQEEKGRTFAGQLHGFIPVIYAAHRKRALAQNWKIKFNETGKIPAFFNTVPELNHNEMTSFDVRATTRALSYPFAFIFLHDAEDDARVQKRMRILTELYRERGLPVISVSLEGETLLDKIFSGLVLADWTAYYTAEAYQVDPEQVPLVEEFKKRMAQ